MVRSSYFDSRHYATRAHRRRADNGRISLGILLMNAIIRAVIGYQCLILIVRAR